MIKEGCFVSISVNGFQPGHVLTNQMLEASYNFPRDLADIIYREFDNCVISGLDYCVESDEVYLLPGVVKFKGDLYFLSKKVSLTELWDDYKQVAIKKGGTEIVYFLVKKDSQVNADGCCNQTLAIELSETYDPNDSINVGAFQGVRGKLELPDLKSIDSIYNRNHLWILDVPYLGANGVGFHPLVSRFLKSSIEQKNKKNSLDYMLWMSLCEHKSIGLDVLIVYLKSKSVPIAFRDNSLRKNIIMEIIKVIKEDDIGEDIGVGSSSEEPRESVIL